MKIKPVWGWIGSLLFLASCSSLSRPAVESRIPAIKIKWVKRSTIKSDLRPRYIESFKPLLYKELILYGNALDSFAAYSKKTGDLKWRFPVDNGAQGGAELYEDSVVFGGNNGQFYRVSAKDGSLIWSFPTRTETLSPPLVEGDRVYFLSGNNTLYCLNAETGKQVWIYTRRDTSPFSIRGGSRPVIKAGKLFVGFSDGSIVAFRAQDGSVLWEQRLNRNKKFRDLDSTPVISGFEMFITGYDDAVYNLDWSTGEVNWKYQQGGYGPVLLTGETLVFTSTDGQIVGLDKKSGKRKWFKPVKGVASTPSIYKGYLVYGESGGFLKVIDKNAGKDLVEFEPGRGVFTPPLVLETGDVFFGSNQANLYAARIVFESPVGKWPWEK